METCFLSKDDPKLSAIVQKEATRLENSINLIAAENHAPRSIMEAIGSVFNTKTIEGYPGKRFHGGCIYADELESLAIERAKKLFKTEYANVQPHSGTSANIAIYFAILKLGDKVLSMSLPHGGHLSHGHHASITSKCFNFEHYTIDKNTEQINYDSVRDQAMKFKPRMIVAGASSYARLIDYEKMAQIAHDVSAYLMVDMAHLSGLVAAGVIPSPIPHSDFVTFTCYKTMMGGRGGVILAKADYANQIDKAVFPGCQGTSAVNLIAAKALIFKLATTPNFVKIQQKTLDNAAQLAVELKKRNYRIVFGGTETHQVIVDLSTKGLTGKQAEKILDSVGIVLNRNVIPKDALKPGQVSGIRIGSAGISTRGMGKTEISKIVDWIDTALTRHNEPKTLTAVKNAVEKLCYTFPVYC